MQVLVVTHDGNAGIPQSWHLEGSRRHLGQRRLTGCSLGHGLQAKASAISEGGTVQCDAVSYTVSTCCCVSTLQDSQLHLQRAQASILRWTSLGQLGCRSLRSVQGKPQWRVDWTAVRLMSRLPHGLHP